MNAQDKLALGTTALVLSLLGGLGIATYLTVTGPSAVSQLAPNERVNQTTNSLSERLRKALIYDNEELRRGGADIRDILFWEAVLELHLNGKLLSLGDGGDALALKYVLAHERYVANPTVTNKLARESHGFEFGVWIGYHLTAQ